MRLRAPPASSSCGISRYFSPIPFVSQRVPEDSHLAGKRSIASPKTSTCRLFTFFEGSSYGAFSQGFPLLLRSLLGGWQPRKDTERFHGAARRGCDYGEDARNTDLEGSSVHVQSGNVRENGEPPMFEPLRLLQVLLLAPGPCWSLQ